MDGSPGRTTREWVELECDQRLLDEWSDELSIRPVTAQLLLQRGMSSVDEAKAFLNPTLGQMHDPFLMKGMDEAVEVLLEALERNDRIVVHGDYDVDGISSCSVLYEFLGDIGAQVSYFIPRRDIEGYGLNIETIRRLQHEGAQLLITTDCGISNVDEISVAKALDMKTIVVDHHTVPDVLPPADAILNPLRPGCEFPFKSLAAVGVAFNFVVALRKTLRERGLFQYVEEPDLRNYLDLVALGTIADVVPLVDENRIFAKFGLEMLAKRRRAGVSALIDRACPDVKKVTTQTVGFQLAPRLNAAGRMGDAGVCVELLTTRQYARAVELAAHLESLNKERQVTERAIMAEALEQAEHQAAEGRPILVVIGDGWNRGVLGIVASRLMERYHRPAILLGADEELGRGSARSVSGISLIEALSRVSELLITYGGHTSAAGLAVARENLDVFRSSIFGVVAQMLEEEPAAPPRLEINATVSLGELDSDMLEDINRLEPFGSGNPEPVLLARDLKTSKAKVVGKKHLRARFHDDSGTLEGIGFSMSHHRDLLDDAVSVAFVPSVSRRRGQEKLEMHIRDIRLASIPSPDRVERVETEVVEDLQEADDHLADGEQLELGGMGSLPGT